MELKCVWCDGAGQIGDQKLHAIQAEQDMWCSCGNPSGDVHFHDDEPGSKHHWTCGDCGGVLQVG